MAPRAVHELLNHDQSLDQRQQQSNSLPNLPTQLHETNPSAALYRDLLHRRPTPNTSTMTGGPSSTPPYPPGSQSRLMPVAKLPPTSVTPYLMPTVQPPQPPPQTMHLASLPPAPPRIYPASLTGPPPPSAPLPPPLPRSASDLQSPSASFDTSNSSSPRVATPPNPSAEITNKKRRRATKSKSKKGGAAAASNAAAAATAATTTANVDGVAPNDAPANSTPTGKSMRHASDPYHLGRTRAIPDELAKPNAPARLSNIDRSPHLVSLPPIENGGRQYQVFRGNKGYRSIRGTHPVCMEAWYYEVDIKALPGKGAVRLGWATRSLDYETPVGYFEGSYGLRCQTGEFVSGGRRRRYAADGVKVGDIVGCLIVLPKSVTENQQSKLKALDEKWLNYYYVAQKVGDKPTPLNIEWEKAYCEWFKNGESMGIPEFFPCCPTRTDESREPGKFPGALYFPCVSLYNDAVIAVNMGPKFKYDIPENAKPYVECAPLAEESDIEQAKPKKRARKNGNGTSSGSGNGGQKGDCNGTPESKDVSMARNNADFRADVDPEKPRKRARKNGAVASANSEKGRNSRKEMIRDDNRAEAKDNSTKDNEDEGEENKKQRLSPCYTNDVWRKSLVEELTIDADEMSVAKDVLGGR